MRLIEDECLLREAPLPPPQFSFAVADLHRHCFCSDQPSLQFTSNQFKWHLLKHQHHKHNHHHKKLLQLKV
ncbi:hypothetical protein P8452_15471 [Trifolium repens]|nr:hypothetical protein P8452_15471 [Trifolium repens]